MDLQKAGRLLIPLLVFYFPRKGKPGFNLEEGEQIDILNKLGKS